MNDPFTGLPAFGNYPERYSKMVELAELHRVERQLELMQRCGVPIIGLRSYRDGSMTLLTRPV